MNLLQALGQAMRIPELRRKLVITIGLVLAFRVLANVSIPGADPKALQALFSSNSLLACSTSSAAAACSASRSSPKASTPTSTPRSSCS